MKWKWCTAVLKSTSVSMLTETSDGQRKMKKRRKTCIQMNMNLKKCCEEGVFVLSLFLYVSSEAHLSFLHTNNCATKVTGTGNTIDDKVRASDQPVARIHLIFLTTSQRAWHFHECQWWWCGLCYSIKKEAIKLESQSYFPCEIFSRLFAWWTSVNLFAYVVKL